MKENTIIILAVLIGIFVLLLVNLTRIVWTKFTPPVDIGLIQENSCLQGGGTVVRNGFGEYYLCEEPK